MSPYPVTFSVEYPERQLNRLTTAFRILTLIPIAILASSIVGWETSFDNAAGTTVTVVGGGTGLLFLPVALMVVFRRRYPHWWYDWNLNLQRFLARIGVYAALMEDRYPATEEEQAVRLDYPYPNAETDLNRWLPIVKWLLAIPHVIVLAFLFIGAFFAVVFSWFAILFTGRYPRGAFEYVEGVMRWHNRVIGYAVTLVTDEYPPFRLGP